MVPRSFKDRKTALPWKKGGAESGQELAVGNQAEVGRIVPSVDLQRLQNGDFVVALRLEADGVLPIVHLHSDGVEGFQGLGVGFFAEGMAEFFVFQVF